MYLFKVFYYTNIIRSTNICNYLVLYGKLYKIIIIKCKRTPCIKTIHYQKANVNITGDFIKQVNTYIVILFLVLLVSWCGQSKWRQKCAGKTYQFVVKKLVNRKMNLQGKKVGTQQIKSFN